MLHEHFISSIGTPLKAANTSVTKDAGIFVYELQPMAAQRSLFKKSATLPQCLAVSDSHIFAAQAGKAIVHVYSREKGNQEALIPFQERITCLALAADDTVLVMGTESGKVQLWELGTGRLVSAPQSHLQAITALAVDPTSNFLLSGSADSHIHVWALPALLSLSRPDSFAQDDPRAPIRTLSNHRGGITALVSGHSHWGANIVLSAAEDSTVMVWDYQRGVTLRTYLIGQVPRALALDPVDRGFYASYDDGSIQLVDFYAAAGSEPGVNALHDPAQSQVPVQPSADSRWSAESQALGAGLSIGLSWDGSKLLSGHASGKIVVWDTSKGKFISCLSVLPGPVTNLAMLPPTGFPNTPGKTLKLHYVTKPRLDPGSNESGAIPENYTFVAQLSSQLPTPHISSAEPPTTSTQSDFDFALTHPSFPSSLLDEGLAELASWRETPAQSGASKITTSEPSADFMSFDDAEKSAAEPTLVDENKLLRQQIVSLRRAQKATFKQLAEKNKEVDALVKEQKARDSDAVAKEKKRSKKVATQWNGLQADETQSDEGTVESDEEADVSDEEMEDALSSGDEEHSIELSD
ncbi:WD40 repeat-like protein [Trichodelitschia bisporula]|uniref:Pre-rRNA-processing protein IPI3 n=1 Tax=Trichodelitschia bisporula TaxID=703511 RepID=A0A6G1HNB8_9PEZI|nr:WD40 repeat-like protein [Trichodelitschia bisporula]